VTDPHLSDFARLDHTGVTISGRNVAEQKEPSTERLEPDRPTGAALEDPILSADGLIVTEGAKIFCRISPTRLYLYDDNGNSRFTAGVEDGKGFFEFQRPTDADPSVVEFVSVTPNLLAIGRQREGELPEVECIFFQDGVVVIGHAASERRIDRPLRLQSGTSPIAGTILEADEFVVGDSLLTKNGFHFNDHNRQSSLSQEELLFENPSAADGEYRFLRVRWDGAYFYKASGELQVSLTKNGVEGP
jgi:hypothetical protein